MIRRSTHMATVRRLLGENRVVALLGPRQIGKTTLARQVADASGSETEYFDLESTRDLARLDDPLLALEPLRGLVILDEIQRRPEIFPTLRVLADPCASIDQPTEPARLHDLDAIRGTAAALPAAASDHSRPALGDSMSRFRRRSRMVEIS